MKRTSRTSLPAGIVTARSVDGVEVVRFCAVVGCDARAPSEGHIVERHHAFKSTTKIDLKMVFIFVSCRRWP